MVEVFILDGYVVQAIGNPESDIFTSAIDMYVIQQSTPVGAVYASEISAYAVQKGRADSVATSDITAYVIIGDQQVGSQVESVGRVRVGAPIAYLIETP